MLLSVCICGHVQFPTLRQGARIPPSLRAPRPVRWSNGSSSPPAHGVACGRELRSRARPIVSLQAQESGEMAKDVKSTNTFIKMCGLTNAEDAAAAARAGATLIGMIMAPGFKRSVTLERAREIAAAAREIGAEPVGVFVDENAAEIERACCDANISIVQLHGDGARASLLQGLPKSLKVIYVLHANKNGVIQTSIPKSEGGPLVDWVLVDGLKGGSGEQFDWSNFQVPSMESREGWVLAGGLTPWNVATALSLVAPNAVDVSSGIAGSDGIRKDAAQIQAFVEAVQNPSLPIQV